MTEYTESELGELLRECDERISEYKRLRSVVSEIQRINWELNENKEELCQEQIEFYQEEKEEKKEDLEEMIATLHAEA